MTVTSNETFRLLLRNYNLPDDFSFTTKLREEVKKIIQDEIVQATWGTTLAAFSKHIVDSPEDMDKGIIQDDANHFHVDWYIEPPDNRNAFMLGVKTIQLLAEKFRNAGYNRMRFRYSFQTPELGHDWAVVNGLQKEGDVHYISDRLSFYSRGEVDIYSEDHAIDSFWAVLIIDI